MFSTLRKKRAVVIYLLLTSHVIIKTTNAYMSESYISYSEFLLYLNDHFMESLM